MPVSNAEMLTLVRELPIPVPWDRDKFITNLAQLRGRPITLIPTDTAGLADGPCGLWLARDHDDLIFHESGTSDYHIDQIICHEIGHMVLGHGHFDAPDDDRDRKLKLCSEVLPDIDPSKVRALLGRADYASDQEREAESFASVVMLAVAEAADQRSMLRSAFFGRR